MAGVFFLVAAAFLAGAFFSTAGALVFVTRPDLVLPSTRVTSASTAGAGASFALGLPALALGLAAAVFLVGVVAFLALGAAAAFLAAGFFAVVVFAFYATLVGTWDVIRVALTVVVAFLVLVAVAFFSALGSATFSFFAVAGLLSFFASFTGPEAPRQQLANIHLKLESRSTRQTGDAPDPMRITKD